MGELDGSSTWLMWLCDDGCLLGTGGGMLEAAGESACGDDSASNGGINEVSNGSSSPASESRRPLVLSKVTESKSPKGSELACDGLLCADTGNTGLPGDVISFIGFLSGAFIWANMSLGDLAVEGADFLMFRRSAKSCSRVLEAGLTGSGAAALASCLPSFFIG